MLDHTRLLLDVMEEEYIFLEQLRTEEMRRNPPGAVSEYGRDRAMAIWDRQATIIGEAQELSKQLGEHFPLGWGDQWYRDRRLQEKSA